MQYHLLPNLLFWKLLIDLCLKVIKLLKNLKSQTGKPLSLFVTTICLVFQVQTSKLRAHKCHLIPHERTLQLRCVTSGVTQGTQMLRHHQCSLCFRQIIRNKKLILFAMYDLESIVLFCVHTKAKTT